MLRFRSNIRFFAGFPGKRKSAYIYSAPSSSAPKPSSNRSTRTTPQASSSFAEARNFFQNLDQTAEQEFESSMTTAPTTNTINNSIKSDNDQYSSIMENSEHNNNNFLITNQSSSTSQLAFQVRQAGLSTMADFYAKQGLLSLSTSEDIIRFEEVMQKPSSNLFKILREDQLSHLTIAAQIKKRFYAEQNNNANTVISSYPLLDNEHLKSLLLLPPDDSTTQQPQQYQQPQQQQDIFSIAPVPPDEIETNPRREFFIQWLQRHVKTNAVAMIDMSSLIIPTIVKNILCRHVIAVSSSERNTDHVNESSSSSSSAVVTSTTRIVDYCSFFKDRKLHSGVCPTAAQTTFCDVLYDVIDDVVLQERSSSDLMMKLDFKVVVESALSQSSSSFSRDLLPEYHMLHQQLVNRLMKSGTSRKRTNLNQNNENNNNNMSIEVSIPEVLSVPLQQQHQSSSSSSIIIVCPPSSQDCVRSFDSQTGAAGWMKRQHQKQSETGKQSSSSLLSSVYGSDALTIPVDYFPQLRTEFDETFELQSKLLFEAIMNNVAVGSAVTENNNNKQSSSSTSTSTIQYLIYAVPSCNPLEGEAVVCSVIQRLLMTTSNRSTETTTKIPKLVSLETLGDEIFMMNQKNDNSKEQQQQQEESASKEENNSTSASTNACSSWYTPKEFFKRENYKLISSDNIDESIRQAVAASSLRILPWDATDGMREFDGSYFCVMKLVLETETEPQIEQQKQVSSQQHSHRGGGGSRRRRGPSTAGNTYQHNHNRRWSNKTNLETIERSPQNSIHQEIIGGRQHSSSTMPTILDEHNKYTISSKTLYALLLKSYIDNKEVQEVVEVLEEKESEKKINKMSTSSSTAVGPLDLSSSLELESWRTIQDILASAAAHSKDYHHNRGDQQEQQQQQEEEDELTRTVASYEFSVALSFDDDDDKETMKMNSLLTALREVSVVFDLIERRTPTLKMMQRMTNNAAAAQNMEEDDDDTDDLFNVSYILTLRSSSSSQDEYDFAMRTRDALGYVLLCHGVDAVAKSGKDWMKFVANEK